MKKLVLILCLVAMSVIVKAQDVYTVCYDNVKIHTTADLNGPTSGDLKRNDKVNVISTSGEWAVIDHNGSVAYVLKYFLKKDEVQPSVQNEAPIVEEKPVEQTEVVVVEEKPVEQNQVLVENKADDVAKVKEETPELPVKNQTEASSNDAESYTAVAVDYSFQNITSGIDSHTETELHNGFNIGYFFHRPLTSHFLLLTGLHYQFTIKTQSSKSFMNHDLKIPLKLGYSMKMSKSSSFSVYAGPSLDFNVSTQNREHRTGYDVTTDVVNGTVKGEVNGKKVSSSSDKNKYLGFFDIPVGLGVAFKFSMFGIRIEYEWGLVNRYTKDYRDMGLKWRSDQLMAGFLIII